MGSSGVLFYCVTIQLTVITQPANLLPPFHCVQQNVPVTESLPGAVGAYKLSDYKSRSYKAMS